MSCGSCGFKPCGCLGIIISIIFGAIIGVLFAFNLIPAIATAIWIVFGLAVLFLIFVIAGLLLAGASGSSVLGKCLCRNVSCLLAGIIGTIVLSIVALAVAVSSAVILEVAIVAALAFFFSLMVISLISFVSCLVSGVCSAQSK